MRFVTFVLCIVALLIVARGLLVHWDDAGFYFFAAGLGAWVYNTRLAWRWSA